MTARQYEISEPISLHVASCDGPLTVKGWDRPVVEIEAQDLCDSPRDRWEGGDLTISAIGSCTIRCPDTTKVYIAQVGGPLAVVELGQSVEVETCQGSVLLRDLSAGTAIHQAAGGLRAQSIGGSLNIGQVGGNVSLRSVNGSASAESIRGGLSTRQVTGDLTVGNVGGSARIADLQGALVLRSVGGAVSASMLSAGMNLEAVGGNLRLQGPLAAGQSYRANVGADVALGLPESSSARLELTALGKIRSDLPLTSVEREDSGHLVGLLGDGAATVTITANGSIRIVAWTESASDANVWLDELEGLAETIDRQVKEALSNVHFASVGRQIDQQINDAFRDVDFAAVEEHVESRMAWAESKLESVDWERLGQEARKAAADGVAKAQEAIQQALARLQPSDIANPVEGRTKTVGTAQDVQARPAAGPTDEERMAVLRMVERGQITPEEGEMLLDALET